MNLIEKLAKEHYPEYYSAGLGVDRIGFERGYNLGISSQTEISDEEIEKEIRNRYMTPIADYAWRDACKWYREKLKSKL